MTAAKSFMPVTEKPADFDAYWDAVLSELATIPLAVDIEVNPLRTTDFATCYHLRLTSIGPYRLYAYYSAPHGDGPFPAILQTPDYASVVQVPPYVQRQRYASMAICARGQRLSDTPYASSFPGQLTVGIDDPETYIYRGIVADTVRAIDFLLNRQEVDSRRITLNQRRDRPGGDVALISAALRPRVRMVVSGSPMFYNARGFAPETDAYPLEELNDYRRAYPEKEAAMWRTLSYFDPLFFARRITADVLICSGWPGTGTPHFNRETSMPLLSAIAGAAELHEATGYGFLDHKWTEAWRERHQGDASHGSRATD